MLPEIIKNIKRYKNDLFLVLGISFVAILSFGLGRLSKIRENKVPITIETESYLGEVGTTTSNLNLKSSINNGVYVASKTGTKYHFPWCAGALNIKESNKIWFKTVEEAKKAGYEPAANCKGL